MPKLVRVLLKARVHAAEGAELPTETEEEEEEVEEDEDRRVRPRRSEAAAEAETERPNIFHAGSKG